MDKKYIENFKKNIDICALSLILSIWSVFIFKIIIFHIFGIMLAQKYEMLGILLFFISIFAGYKKSRKDNNEEEIKEAEDLIHDCVNFAEKSQKNTRKFFNYITSPKSKNIEEYFKNDSSDTTESEETKTSNDDETTDNSNSTPENTDMSVEEESKAEDDLSTEISDVDASTEENKVEDDLLSDEEISSEDINNESTDTTKSEETKTPLHIFIRTWLITFIVITCIYLIAMLICWTYPCAGAMGLLLVGPIVVGFIDAFY